MPLPKPENEKEFINRCMSDEESKKEFPDNEQRIAVCQSIWDASRLDEDELNDDILAEIVKTNLE